MRHRDYLLKRASGRWHVVFVDRRGDGEAQRVRHREIQRGGDPERLVIVRASSRGEAFDKATAILAARPKRED